MQWWLVGNLCLKIWNQNLNQPSRGNDTSVDVELCGSIWDNIDSKDGVYEWGDERAYETGVENFTSEST